jgi:hypothetical protein
VQQFIISFHVNEASLADAETWKNKVLKILESYKPQLVSPTTGAGTWCSGHVEAVADQAPSKPNVVEMTPRE